MDRPKPERPSRRRWPFVALALALGAAALLYARQRTEGAAVDRASIVVEVARRGLFVHEISAPGALIPEQTRLLSAPAAGRVEALHVQNGDAVHAGQPVVTLVNRDVVEALLELEQQLAVAESDRADLAATVEGRLLESRKTLRRTEFEKRDAERQAEATSRLAREGLTSELEDLRMRETAAELENRVVTEKLLHQTLERSAAAQLQAQQNRIDRLRALHSFRKAAVDALVVRTPAAGTIRDVLVQPGESVSEGQRMARLVEPGRLKAVLQVPEALVLEVKTGQRVTMNARGMSLRGAIARVGATVEQGTIAVDVRLDGEPRGLRPDLSVDGRIEVGRLNDVLSIARPANADAHASGALYRLDANGRTAERIDVRFGAASADRIVINSGAAPGDRIVVAGLERAGEKHIRLH